MAGETDLCRLATGRGRRVASRFVCVLAALGLLVSCSDDDADTVQSTTSESTTSSSEPGTETDLETLDVSATADAEGDWVVFEQSEYVDTSIEVPADWETDSYGLADNDEVVGLQLEASADLDAESEYEVPSVDLRVWGPLDGEDVDTVAALDEQASNEDCTYEGRGEITGENLSGHYDLYSACAGGEASFREGVVQVGEYEVELEAVITDSVAETAVMHALATLEIG
ncbi:MAG: hypothetical protein JJLCMIEE_01932 [Acidimicrobiales bacterium]|nr:hypothetical protein [Acidimicrobiales bacterium]